MANRLKQVMVGAHCSIKKRDKKYYNITTPVSERGQKRAGIIFVITRYITTWIIAISRALRLDIFGPKSNSPGRDHISKQELCILFPFTLS